MNNFEFLSYEPVQNEKFFGIATIRAWSKIILKYKVIPGKDGGFFIAASSIKNGVDASTGKDKYESVFMIDSVYENKELLAMVKEKVSDHLNEPSKPKEASSVIDDDVPF